jgi:aspartyl-tRNA(Asn)/glutamyl-tRNA(Gln) amidotransferase subunit B
LNTAKKTLEESPIPARNVGTLVKLILGGSISTAAAKKVFDEMFANGGDPEAIVKAKGLVQVDDSAQISRWIDEVIAENAKIVADVKGGNPRAAGALVGAVMKKSQGRTVNKLLKEKLSV